MNTLYLDLFSGISGDMFVGALIDLGVGLGSIESGLDRLSLPGFHLHCDRRRMAQIEGVKFDVHLDSDHAGHEAHHGSRSHDHHHEHSHHTHGKRKSKTAKLQHSHEESRDFTSIRQLINKSSLNDWIKSRSIAVFHRIAVAEGKIHGHPPEEVHFHEVGAIDSIVDIVGTCIALDVLRRPKVLASHVIDGTGWLNCAHGRFPIPAPATLEILGARGIHISQCEEPSELVTPTGAALLAEFAESFGPMEGFSLGRIGYGLGTRENRTRPNVLRAILGDSSSPAPSGRAAKGNDWESDTIAVLETNLDDLSAEILGHFVEQAFAAGALDVFHTPIQMKKNRPGVLLTVLCSTTQADLFSELILRETSAFGVRRSTADRRKLRRESISVKTEFGEVSVKLGKLNGEVVQVAPEFESCKTVAMKAKCTLKTVYESALRATPRKRKK